MGCSKDCSAGVMSRSRNIEVEPDHGGQECTATTDSQLCNVDDCVVPCVLSDWTEWSGCSKRCGGGIDVRKKGVLVESKGNGFCDHPNSDERFEQRPCNDLACDPTQPWGCQRKIDIVLLLDASGSVRKRGWKRTKKFATWFVDQALPEGLDPTIQIAVVTFSKKSKNDIDVLK